SARPACTATARTSAFPRGLRHAAAARGAWPRLKGDCVVVGPCAGSVLRRARAHGRGAEPSGRSASLGHRPPPTPAPPPAAILTFTSFLSSARERLAERLHRRRQQSRRAPRAGAESHRKAAERARYACRARLAPVRPATVRAR